MASHDPDSVATVPSQVLGLLQDFMQTHWEQPNRVANAQHSDEQPASNNEKSATVPESAERSCPSPPTATTKPPSLRTSKSAPDMEISPENDMTKAPMMLNRAQSYQFGGDFGGDTQELTSQELRESISISMSRPIETPGTAQRTQKEGDNGYINLESEWDIQGFEEDFLRDETQTERPAPTTPAWSKDRDAEMPTTTKKTPHYSQFFGAANPVMTASQLIDQTQQASSPPVDRTYSDPIDHRPSPGERSSPSMVWFSNSSPDLGRTIRPSTAPGEPRAFYRSMQESQALRTSRAAFQSPGRPESVGDDDEIEEEPFNTKRRKIRRALSDNALRVTAPARPGSRRSWKKGSRQSMIDLTTPAPAKRQRVKFEDLKEQDENTEHFESLEEEAEEPLHDEEYVATPLGSVQDDEYDEFSQNIVSQANEPQDDASTVASLDPIDQEMDEQPPEEVEEEGTRLQERSTQRSTIADSQQDLAPPAIIRHVQHSSTTSFVPGSQHAGKTSEDQALLALSQRRNRVAASQVDREDSNGAEKLPSSPPLLRVSSTLPEDSVEASLARQDMLEKFKSSTVPGEIPESDLAENEASRLEVAVVENGNEDTQDTARDGAPFSTARTHVSGSVESPARRSVVPSPRKPSQSQRSHLTDPSPRKLAGVRRFADFATNGTSTNGSFDIEADVDDVMLGVITEEDQQVWDRTSGLSDLPRMNKRRKLDKSGSSRTTSTNSNVAQDNHSVLVEESVDEQANGVIAESEPDIPRPESPPVALRDSPNKANEMLPPENKGKLKAAPDDVVSESVMLREKAGSDAVSQLVRARGTAAAKKAKQVTYGRSSRRKSSRAKSITADEDVIEEDQTSTKATSAMDHGMDQSLDAGVEEPHAAVEQSILSMDVGAPHDLAVNRGQQPSNNLSRDDMTALNLNPKRVFALFKGAPLAFYPATWMGSSPDSATFKIRFDDGAETNIETQHVKTLDLRIDDSIKVNVPGLRNKTWRIAGFGGPAQTREERGFATDANGHIRVKIQAKSSRNSLSNDASSEAAGDADDVREVLVEHIYLTNTMWPSFADRQFTPPAKIRADRAQTPLAHEGTPESEPPPSRSRRAIVPTAKAKGSGLRLSHLRDTSTSSSRSANSTGIFSGMAFAVTYVSNDAQKADVTRLIGRHGGMILDGGFEELFELPNIGEASTEPSKEAPQKKADEPETGLRLKPEYKDLGFVALIADKHSRRAKYMQALALGLPTLSGRWIIDSLDPSKNKSTGTVDPLPWERFLLAAGESAYLGGAVRSRTLQPYEIASAELSATISTRALLLDGENVLIVAPKKDKAGWEKRRTYAFLTLALGAGEVKRVYDLGEAKALIEEDPTSPKWLYVEGSVAKAKDALLHTAGKKRKRSEALDKGNVRIVDDEFVVQSLILGALHE
ncbi:hypothetical protein M409DRAFT_19105 [Zasmidium cellare ATCC 36951]|uniref:BRCT domain-containing protein n=1 Tax=Zasmidium cellare ATCC 36951 TaxID=1080233 RepID=A0A6A6CVS0_ZASCE|nr:uncharacterized protein M409DRAFT_19105 [Zasmidium cellare ATCC 36951]KAF2171135.1 hypothetical protein M409DRAFT_19105 [Zasmidium cellare ATCC 36951]